MNNKAKRKSIRPRTPAKNKYPRIIFKTKNAGDLGLVHLLRKIVDKFSFESLGKEERLFYRMLKKRGFEFLVHEIFRGSVNPAFTMAYYLTHLGKIFHDQIPKDTRKIYFPFHHVEIRFSNNDILVQFSSLNKIRGSQGSFYVSQYHPIMEFNKTKYQVGFSRHAIERMTERLNPKCIEYAASGYLHHVLQKTFYYEPQMIGGEPAFTFYSPCSKGLISYVYVEKLIGEKNVNPNKGKFYHRLGYCPVVLRDGFAVAKTLLYPGYSNTPEYNLILKSNLKKAEKRMLIDQATSQTLSSISVDGNMGTIRWCHRNGIPQVIQTRRPMLYGAE